MPVEHHVSCDVPVSDRIACWEQLSSLTEIETEVREWLVTSPHVEDLATNNILWSSGSDGAAERLDLSDGMRVLIETLLTE